MEEILNNLHIDEVLHVTARGTEYRFIGRSVDNGVNYSINQEQKTLPFNTINGAFIDFLQGIQIDAQWYTNHNQHEYETRPCNLSVLKELLNRLE
jgi:hypothetical protein